MKELLIIAVGSALVNNVVLSQFLGICPFLGVSKKIETAAGMGGAAILAAKILATSDPELLQKLKDYTAAMKETVQKKAEKLE